MRKKSQRRDRGTHGDNDYTNVGKSIKMTLNSKHRAKRKQRKHTKKKRLVFQKKGWKVQD